MGVRAHLHQTHRQFAKGLAVVEVEGNTVRECLNHLIKQFPDMEKRLFQKEGNLLNGVEIYVNLKSAYPDELAMPVKDGDEIHITLMLAGG